MSLERLLEYNRKFVAEEKYKQYETDSIPNKKMVIFTCMESRLIELLLKAFDLKNGDVKMLKNAGAIIRKPFDSIMKSILVAVYELKAEEIIVVGHHDCGMSRVDTTALVEHMKERGVTQETLDTLKHAGIYLEKEFHGFDTVEKSIEQSVRIIRNHPLLPKQVKVHGLVIDPHTGKADVVTRE